jgi:hypothetical protein
MRQRGQEEAEKGISKFREKLVEPTLLNWPAPLQPEWGGDGPST